MFDKFKDECGVFGIFGHPEAANMTYLGLYALQHRGQESAGIAASDAQQVRISREMGYVADIFDGETLAECCFDSGGLGAEVSIDSVDISTEGSLDDAAALFGESASRIIVSAAPDYVTRVLEQAATAKVPARVIGQTGGNRLRIAIGGRMTIDMSIEDAERAWSAAIDSYFAKKIA